MQAARRSSIPQWTEEVDLWWAALHEQPLIFCRRANCCDHTQADYDKRGFRDLETIRGLDFYATKVTGFYNVRLRVTKDLAMALPRLARSPSLRLVRADDPPVNQSGEEHSIFKLHGAQHSDPDPYIRLLNELTFVFENGGWIRRN